MTRAVALALLTAACAPSPSGPFQAEIVRFDAAQGRYVPGVVEVKTLTDLSAMDGAVVRLIAGARFRIDPFDLQSARTLAEFKARVLEEPGEAPSFAGFESGGVVRGEDFHSVNVLTTYWNFERANLWFAEHGAREVAKLDVYYFPELVLVQDGETVTETDNALFYPAFQSFLVLPFASLATLPLSMNEGIIAHEYSHAVFNARVFGGEPVPWPFARLEEDPAAWVPQLNMLVSLDEGLADFFGGTIVGDPAFMARSLPDLAAARDPRTLRCATPQMREALLALTGSYDPYPLGTVLHHVLWSMAMDGGDAVAAAAVGSMPAFAADLKTDGPGVDERQLLARIVERLPAEKREAACGLAADRFRRAPAEISGCAGAPPPAQRCP